MTQDSGTIATHRQPTSYPTLTDLFVTAGIEGGPVRVARAANDLAQIEDDYYHPLKGSQSASGDSWVKSYIYSQKVRVYR